MVVGIGYDDGTLLLRILVVVLRLLLPLRPGKKKSSLRGDVPHGAPTLNASQGLPCGWALGRFCVLIWILIGFSMDVRSRKDRTAPIETHNTLHRPNQGKGVKGSMNGLGSSVTELNLNSQRRYGSATPGQTRSPHEWRHPSDISAVCRLIPLHLSRLW